MLTDHALNDVVLIMDTVHGFDLSIFDESFLQKTIDGRCAANNMPALPDYADFLSNSFMEAETLQNSLNISYSEFFRNTLIFANLEQWILPKMIEQKSNSSELRIWSAGCSSGQEPYSVAMLLDKYCKTSEKALRYRIIATDISQTSLDAAKKGEYNEDAVQNVKVKQMKEYFTKIGDKYIISSALKEHVDFSNYDLLDKSSFYPQESIFGNFDIVFCSNLLFYYNPGQQQFILRKLTRSMAKDGYLITGEAEKYLAANKIGLRMAAPPAAIFQMKVSGGAR